MAKGNEMLEKVKQKSLTIKQKLEILQLLKERRMSKTEIAKKFGVDRSAIRKIEINENKILRMSSMGYSANHKKKYIASGRYHRLEQALFYWFLQMRDKNEIVTTNLIKLQARKFSNKLQIPDEFKFSAKWIHNFKKRYGIRRLKITGEKLSCDGKSIEPFKDDLFNRVAEIGLSADQIYNADESALFYKSLPGHSLVHSQEQSAPGHKVAKQRVTFMPCANATGTHKLPILMIGNSKKPRAFKNVQIPLQYSSSKNAWMTRSIFKQWFLESFVPSVRKFSAEKEIEPKAILLLDNCSAHHFEDELISDDRLISVCFLPPNVTPLIQPMDQHVIQAIKSRYREKVHNEIVFGDTDATLALKKINLKHVAFWLQEAWAEVSRNVLQRAWKNIGIIVGSELIHEDDVPLSILFKTANTETSTQPEQCLEEELCVDDYNDAQIVAMVNDEPYSEEQLEEQEELEESDTTGDFELNSPTIDFENNNDRQAVRCLNFAIDWAEANGFELADILHLRRIKSAALGKCSESKHKGLEI